MGLGSPLLQAQEGGRSYGTLRDDQVVPARAAGSSNRRIVRTSALIALVALGCVCVLAVTISRLSPVGHTGLLQNYNDVDNKYLEAESSGEGGRDFLKRLQRMWFVMEHKDHKELAKQASELAVEMLISTFPSSVKSSINTAVNPCEDFYEFACGKWDDNNHNSIPKFSTSWALSWDRAEENIVNNMITVLQEDKGPAGEYFRACTDIERIEEAGSKPLEPWFELIDKIHDRQSLLDVVVELNKGGMDHLYSWYIDTDSHDNTQHAFFLSQTDPSLPDITYYLDDTPEMKGHRAKMLERVTYFFKLVGRENAEQEAKLVMQYETDMSKIMQDRTEAYKEHAQEVTWSQVSAMVPSWKWSEWLTKLSQCTKPFNNVPQMCTKDHVAVLQVGRPGGKKLYMRNKDYFEKLDNFINTQSLDAIKAEMRWRVIQDSASSLSNKFQDALLDWYKDLYGVQEKSARTRKCYYSTTSSVGWASAKLYSDKLFHHKNIHAAREMLDQIRFEFHKAIPDANWMSAQSRDAAQNKLAQMFFEVGVPTDKAGDVKWPERTDALVGKLGKDYFVNGEISTRISIERSMHKLTLEPKRMSWGSSTPLEVNAFYGPKSNGLWIPAGILQQPFFDFQNSDAQNYGSVGTILGHEMSHAFDDDGSQYDARGELKDWWDAQTVAGFKERSKCLANVFDKFSVLDKKVNGKLTLGEDIADAGGLKFSYRALLHSKPRSDAEKRLFFTAFAQTWCEVDRKKSALSSVLTDVHAPGKFRVIGALTQFKPFAEAFQCADGSPMSPSDETRCHLW